MWVSGLDPGSPRLSELQGVVPEAWLKRACVPGLQSATCGRPPARGRQASPCRVGPAVTRKRSGSGSGVGAGRMAADTQVRLAAAGPTRRAAGPERGQRGRDCPGAVCGADGRGGRRRRRRGGGAGSSRLEARTGLGGQSDPGLEDLAIRLASGQPAPCWICSCPGGCRASTRNLPRFSRARGAMQRAPTLCPHLERSLYVHTGSELSLCSLVSLRH